MRKIEKEKKTIDFMVRLYCRHKLKQSTLPAEYAELTEYAHARLDHCRFGEGKSSCKRCPVHCYGKAKREMVRQVMRWSGPRMFLYSPIEAFKHIFK